jgi:hypothetical protein
MAEQPPVAVHTPLVPESGQFMGGVLQHCVSEVQVPPCGTHPGAQTPRSLHTLEQQSLFAVQRSSIAAHEAHVPVVASGGAVQMSVPEQHGGVVPEGIEHSLPAVTVHSGGGGGGGVVSVQT